MQVNLILHYLKNSCIGIEHLAAKVLSTSELVTFDTSAETEQDGFLSGFVIVCVRRIGTTSFCLSCN